MTSPVREIRAARGGELSCRGWPQEAALRMLHNNLDPENAERPQELVVYGGTGKAARDWASFEAIERTLRTLGDDETLLVQSGKPVGVFTTHEWAPRVLLANSNLVGDWDTWDEFRRLEALGLTMYGQMTAGSWIYIGTQGILQGTYETFAAVAAKRFGDSLAGTITLTGGLGGMGGAQPLAVTMAGGVALCVEVDPARIARRIEHGYLDVEAADLDDALRRAVAARDARRPLSIGLLGNCADVVPRLLATGAPIDVVTDQTSAHDPLSYLPSEVAFEDWHDEARGDPQGFTARARASMARHVEAMVGFQDAGAEVFDYGNSLRAEARLGGFERAFAYPGFVPAYIRPLFCEGKGPFRWVALSGDPADIAATDRAILELFADDEPLVRWMRMAADKVQFQGLPARICWLGYGERHRAGVRFNELVAGGEVSAPIAIGRDHLDCGSVASPYRETESMLDGSDAIADWPLLNAMLNVASGASWVSIHDGGGVGIGRSIHAGQVAVADGTPLAAQKLERVLTNDPGTGVIRHVDAGYDRAAEVAGERGVRVPMREGAVTDARYHADYAWLGGERASPEVLIEVAGERISSVRAGVPRSADAVALRGVTLPGLANAHSHAFQRALRGHTHRAGGSFWTWREDMYAVAERLTPDLYHALARAAYAEMALAGIVCVGEFHYVHHDTGGARYADANAFGDALLAAAGEAGIRITLLDACYLAGGPGEELRGAQRRFGDGDAVAWAERAAAQRGAPHARVGAAIHSVRAVPADQLGTVVAWADERAAPLHVHLSEQRAENAACRAAYGRTPARLLADHGALGPRTCAVHATHLEDGDVELLGDAATTICLCPTTERDLADGIGPAPALAGAGSPLALGSDSHAVVDPFEEARALELDERLASERRGHFSAARLLAAAAAGGHAALGWPDAGRLEAGARADLLTVSLDSVRLAGAGPEALLESLVFAAGAADVREVVVGGRRIVADGRHALIGDVPGALACAIAAVAP